MTPPPSEHPPGSEGSPGRAPSRSVEARAGGRSRHPIVAAVTAVLLAAGVGGALLLGRGSGPPAAATGEEASAPSTTISKPQSPPVEVFLVLRHDYTVDETTGACEGSGPLAGIERGSPVWVHDLSVPVREELSTIRLPAGEEVTTRDPGGSDLVPGDDPAACVFALPDLGYDVADYEITLEQAEAVTMVRHESGRRLVFTLGYPPFDPEDLSADGVASDVPEIWGAEIRALRASAGPGRIVGFVNLSSETSTGPPASPSQPVCVGAGAFADIRPGGLVVVTDENGQAVGEDILRGSAYDGHIGCSLWFGVDVPPDLTAYSITLADHPPIAFERDMLADFGWQIDLWTDPVHMQANCVELEEGAEPITCELVEPQR